MDNVVQKKIALHNKYGYIYSKKSLVEANNEKYHLFINGELFIDNLPCNAEGLLSAFEQYDHDLASLYQKLSGQFWFVIVDNCSGNTTVCNDHFGFVPCFYAITDQAIHISDSLKALKGELSLTLSEQSLFNYVYFHCIPSPNTIFNETEKLEPGKVLTIEQNGNALTQLLYKPVFEQSLSDVESAHQQCLSIIDSAVLKNINTDTGAFLSGGLDSSSVAGMLARHDKKARTFSVGFDIPEYDETKYAKITAKHFATEHQVLYLQPDDTVDKFVEVAQYFDEPFGNSSAMATYFCAAFAKQHGITRLLAGDGGDELFAGNTRYAKQKIFGLYQGLGKGMQSISKSLFCHSGLGKLPVASKVASYIRQAEIPMPDRLESYNFVNRFGAQQMFNSDFLQAVDPFQPIKQQRQRYQECTSDELVNQMLYLDWKYTLADNDLVKVSRMCELAGVDVKYPLLDKSLVDFSCLVPANIKLPGKQLRKFYKDTVKGFLPDATLTKSKHGFGLPFGMWMKDTPALKSLALDNLLAFKKRHIIQDSLIDKVLDAHHNQHAGYYGELIWILVVLELWLAQ